MYADFFFVSSHLELEVDREGTGDALYDLSLTFALEVFVCSLQVIVARLKKRETVDTLGVGNSPAARSARSVDCSYLGSSKNGAG